MKNREEILTAITKVTVEKLDCKPEDVVEGAAFDKDLGADSLDVLEICMDLETELDVSIPNHAFDKIKTVGELADFILDDKLPQ
jgi:acyl carrier protein